ncbi:hypothetical protein [Ralstonia mannitolilytica]|uniref:hypothetical protein n=1 Tax=Ralstonia mannitolilytica TaxID=105219 RepID=UPI0028F5C8FF|nr:hypothetical protein [Ralstonia mannitolilytica]CAJ0858324.1 hypothetical protein R76727_01246 [Ralstonia mannitolilytica]
MALSLSTTVINNRLKALTNALDGGGAAGSMLLYGGTRPSQAGGAITDQKLLAKQPLAYPAAGGISGLTLTIRWGNPVLGSASGLATWARFVDSNGTFVADMDAGPVGSGVEIELDSETTPKNQIYEGGVVSPVSLVLIES